MVEMGETPTVQGTYQSHTHGHIYMPISWYMKLSFSLEDSWKLLVEKQMLLSIVHMDFTCNKEV